MGCATLVEVHVVRSRDSGRPRRTRYLVGLLAAAGLGVGAAVGAVVAAAPSVVTAVPDAAAAPTSTAPQLHVSGNELVSAGGQQVVLHGVDRSGTEYACVQGNGIFDGPSDQASITAMKTWR